MRMPEEIRLKYPKLRKPKKKKRMKKDEHLQEQKINEMMEIYKKVALECFTQKQAMKRVVEHQASRFFILPHTAYCKLRKVFSGETDRIYAVKEFDREMYEEILKRVMELSQRPEYYGKSLMQLCEIVVRQPAPKFYMKPITFRIILAKQKKIIRERMRINRESYATER